MFDRDRFNFILSDLIDELPQAFFRELSGGIIVSDEAPESEYSMNNDLFIFGQYRVNNLGRQVVIYRGSFEKFYGHYSEDELRNRLRAVLRHEFRHHMEFLSGIHNSASLEAEDRREIQEYLRRYATIDDPFEK